MLVRYTAVFARPQVGASIKGTVESISSINDRVAVMCAIEGGLSAIVKEADMERYTLKAEDASGEPQSQSSKEKEELREEEHDSVFGDEDEETGKKVQEVYLEEKSSGRTLKPGSKVTLKIEEIVVSEGTLISYASIE